MGGVGRLGWEMSWYLCWLSPYWFAIWPYTYLFFALSRPLYVVTICEVFYFIWIIEGCVLVLHFLEGFGLRRSKLFEMVSGDVLLCMSPAYRPVMDNVGDSGVLYRA